MQAARRLDELVLEVLASQLARPAKPRSSEVSIEIHFDEDEEQDVAATTRFVRVSAPVAEPAIPSFLALPVPPREPDPGVPAFVALPVAAVTRAPSVPSIVVPVAAPAPVPAAAPAPVPAAAPVNANETTAFDRAWFDRDEDALAAIEEVAPRRRRSRSWIWLAISIATAAAATAGVMLS